MLDSATGVGSAADFDRKTRDITTSDATFINVLPEGKLARSRVLAVFGTALVGFATRMVVPDSGQATHQSPQPICYGYGLCHCCNGSACCTSYCEASYNHTHCPSGGQCWYNCYCGMTWQCCDWHVLNTNKQTHCICYTAIAQCGAGC